jgi:hypothetical protein
LGSLLEPVEEWHPIPRLEYLIFTLTRESGGIGSRVRENIDFSWVKKRFERTPTLKGLPSPDPPKKKPQPDKTDWGYFWRSGLFGLLQVNLTSGPLVGRGSES